MNDTPTTKLLNDSLETSDRLGGRIVDAGNPSLKHDVWSATQPEVRQPEIRLSEHRNLLETLLLAYPASVVTIDRDGVIQQVAGGIFERLGLIGEIPSGQKADEVFGAFPEIVASIARGLAGVPETILLRRGSDSFEVRMTELISEGGAGPSLCMTILDVSERQGIMEKLSETRLRLQSIIHSLSDGVIVIMKDGRIDEANNRAAEILGVTREELIGSYPFESNWNSLDEDGRPFVKENAPSRIALRTGRPQWGVVVGLKLCHRTLWLSVNAEPMIRPGETEPFAVVSSFSDITLRRELAEKERVTRDKLTHALRVNTLGEMSTTLAHELNQPLTAITLFCSAMQTLLPKLSGESKAQMGEILQQAIDQAVRAGTVVRRMRGLTRRTKTALTACPLKELVDEVMSLLANDLRLQGIQWTCNIESPLVVMADAIQTQQVLINLVRNGMDAVLTDSSPDRWLRIRGERSKTEPGMAFVSVANSGSPIQQSIREEIFEPYVSSKPDGLGLGLPICRTIVEMQEGKLWLASESNEPTEFRFTLKIIE